MGGRFSAKVAIKGTAQPQGVCCISATYPGPDRRGKRTLNPAGFQKRFPFRILAMGARGPRPETPEIQALKGNPGKRKKRPPSIKPTGDVYIPNYLDEDARQCFEMIVANMPPGTYAATDTGGVAVYAVAWADHKRATEALKTEPPLVPGAKGGLVKNPWFTIRSDAARIMMAMGDRLGLDPKARAALAPRETKPKSKFSGLIGPSAVTG